MERVPVSKPLKLEKYYLDKTTFITKVVNAKKFSQWIEVEECTWVRDTLEGSAADGNWGCHLETLKKRFGNANRAEGYRALLLTMRCQPGETIQVMYTDIRRLLSLAFPGQGGDMFKFINHNYFLSTLDDPALQIRVLDQQPKSLDKCLVKVTQMEAFTNSVQSSTDHSVD